MYRTITIYFYREYFLVILAQGFLSLCLFLIYRKLSPQLPSVKIPPAAFLSLFKCPWNSTSYSKIFLIQMGMMKYGCTFNPTTEHIPRENHNSKNTCTTMFIAALFTIARTWKQPKCPSTDEWIKKMWCIYTM